MEGMDIIEEESRKRGYGLLDHTPRLRRFDGKHCRQYAPHFMKKRGYGLLDHTPHLRRFDGSFCRQYAPHFIKNDAKMHTSRIQLKVKGRTKARIAGVCPITVLTGTYKTDKFLVTAGRPQPPMGGTHIRFTIVNF